MPKKVPAAQLVLGGAPESWHTIVGLPGHFHPTIPTPLDQPGLAPLAVVEAFLAAHAEQAAHAAAEWEAFRAQRIEEDWPDIGPFEPPVAPVELVEINPSQVAAAAAAALEQRQLGARAAAKARRAGEGEVPNVKSETDAVTNGAGDQE